MRTFNEIGDGAPGLSRGLLYKRLRELEPAGVLEIRPKPDGRGSTYQPTQAFARWHLGELRWGDALRSAAIEVQGTQTLARSLPTWHREHERGPQPLHRLEFAGSSP